MSGVRKCAQCGAAFTPRREHARFCSARCRMAWNHEHDGYAAAPVAAIDWSVTAMTEAARRFAWAREWDVSQAAGAVSETVWWITLVDATLVRYHPRDYGNTLADQAPVRRRRIEETLAGLRYVRNQLGCSVDPAELIRSAHDTSRGAPAWIWNPLPEPTLSEMPPSAGEWEMGRYRSYQARLAGREVARVFGRCASFLEQAAASLSAA